MPVLLDGSNSRTISESEFEALSSHLEIIRTLDASHATKVAMAGLIRQFAFERDSAIDENPKHPLSTVLFGLAFNNIFEGHSALVLQVGSYEKSGCCTGRRRARRFDELSGSAPTRRMVFGLA